MRKTQTEYKRAEREKKRNQGFVIKQVYVKPEFWPEIQQFIKCKHK